MLKEPKVVFCLFFFLLTFIRTERKEHFRTGMGVAIVFEVRETQCSGFPFSFAFSLSLFFKEFSPQEYKLEIIN